MKGSENYKNAGEKRQKVYDDEIKSGKALAEFVEMKLSESAQKGNFESELKSQIERIEIAKSKLDPLCIRLEEYIKESSDVKKKNEYKSSSLDKKKAYTDAIQE